MPWEIYLDWLQDQGNEDLRGIDPSYFMSSSDFLHGKYVFSTNENDKGVGDVVDTMFGRSNFVDSYRGEGMTCMGGYGEGMIQYCFHNCLSGEGMKVNPLNMKIGDGEHDRA